MALGIDMALFANDQVMDIALLLSSDKDFIPAIERASALNVRTINAHVNSPETALARASWLDIDI